MGLIPSFPYRRIVMKKISFTSLVLLIIGAIDSIRNLPSSALFGSALIFFFSFAALVFLFPTSLVAAELSALFPEKGGVYYWVLRAFGEKVAMCAIWLQWINTVVWFPTILSFIAGSIAFLVNPSLAASPFYVLSVVLILFWALTFINLFGIHVSTKVNTFCSIIGTIFPLLFLILLSFFWLVKGNPSQITFTSASIFPTFEQAATWVSLISIMASFLGMELTGVHVNEIDQPERNFPRALLLSCAFILFSMLFGSLAIAIVVPKGEINLIAGVLQVFAAMLEAFHLGWMVPFLALFIVIGSVGNIINWLISPAKGFLHAAEFGYLPPLFTKKNRYGVASALLIAQAIFVSLFCLLFFLVPSVNAFYWFLTALSTALYMMMYLLMFLSALALHYRYPHRVALFKIPGGSIGMWITTILGLVGCLLTIVVGFFAPETIAISSPLHYAGMIGAGLIVMLLPLLFFFFYKRRYQA